jgi:hypothetical protein
METQFIPSPLDVLVLAGIIADGLPDVIERDANGCAIWPLGKTGGGYGYCFPRPGETAYVHRLVCAAAHGPIPDGWHVDHVWENGCRSRACFWPDHLEAVTPAENVRRMGIAIRASGPRPCGHSWDDDRPGRSDCAVCHRESQAARQARRPKPTIERARLIRRLLDLAVEEREIALIAGASRMTVRRIRKGEVHANVC